MRGFGHASTDGTEVHATAIVVAAGPGSRLGAGRPKGFVELGGMPLFVRSLHAMVNTPGVAAAVAVIPPGTDAFCQTQIDAHGPWPCPVRIVAGGAERQDSVRAGIEQAGDADVIAIHDAARPFVATATVARVLRAAARDGAAIAGLPVADTVKQVHPDGWIEATPPRDRLWLAQTPQAFRAALIRRAHAQAIADGVNATDDAMLVERLGVRVLVVEGNPENRKITTPDDLRWAEWLLSSGAAPR